MIFGWPTKKERILRGVKISAKNKLEGIRLMNELADKVLSGRQRAIRAKLRQTH